MSNILYITDNPKDINIENVTVLRPDELSLYRVEPHGVILGKISSVDNAELAKKYIIDKKINGSFITVNICLGDKGELFKKYDNSMVKKMKEVCLFADLVLLNYTEAMIFSNIPYTESCEEKDIKRIVFMLNSYGMVNRVVIFDVPFGDNEKSAVVSELGEYKITELTETKKSDLLITNALLKGKKINEILL